MELEDREVQCTQCFENNQLVISFANQKTLNQHIKQVHDPPPFKCTVCFKTFRDPSSFETHKRTHSHATIQEHKCALCPKAYRFKLDLKIHLFYVHKQRREGVRYFKCELCSREFVYRSELERHVIHEHVVDKAFECLVCSNTFIDQQSLEKHMKTHNRQIEYFCHVCSKGFTLKKWLAHHLQVKHSLFFYCFKCCNSFEIKRDFNAHILDSKQELKCYICQETMNSECSLKIHVDAHVNDIKTERGDIKIEKPIKFLETNKPFTPRPRKKLNLEKLDLKCELCAEAFDRESYFAAHRRCVHPNAEWKCNFQECSKIFNVYNRFRLHKLMHAGIKEYTCNICGKFFSRSDSLKEHEQVVHVKENKYKCEICPKSFTAPCRLRDHLANSHGGPKPFKCPVVNCGTSWASNRQLKNHLIKHETETSFKCEICQKKVMAYKSLDQLKVHQRIVHSVKKKTNAPGFSSQNSKHSDAVVFICSSNTCSFETVSEAEVALHYNRQHELPQVLILQNSSSSPLSLVSEKKECSPKMGKMIERRYKCQICSKLFKNVYLLTQHLQIHSSGKQIKCSFCYKTFKLQRYLKQHIALHHSKNQRKR